MSSHRALSPASRWRRQLHLFRLSVSLRSPLIYDCSLLLFIPFLPSSPRMATLFRVLGIMCLWVHFMPCRRGIMRVWFAIRARLRFETSRWASVALLLQVFIQSYLFIYLLFCQRRVNLYFLSISRHCLFFVHDKCGTKTYVYMSRNSQIYISHTRAHIKYTYTCTYKIHTHMHIQNSHTHTYRIHIHTYKTPPPTQ